MADQSNRNVLKQSIAAICKQLGFDNADDICLETLVEMIHSRKWNRKKELRRVTMNFELNYFMYLNFPRLVRSRSQFETNG